MLKIMARKKARFRISIKDNLLGNSIKIELIDWIGSRYIVRQNGVNARRTPRANVSGRLRPFASMDRAPGENSELSEEKRRPWLPLLPKLEKLAVAGDASIRDATDQRLGDFPQERQFLAKRVELETSPDILMRLMYQAQEREEFNQRLVVRLYSLLMY